MVEPIRPEDIVTAKAQSLPDKVIEIFNELIAQAWDGHSSIVEQNEVAERIANALGISRKEVFSQRLLEVESVYQAAGWKVQYDKPAYNESYPPTFTFSKP